MLHLIGALRAVLEMLGLCLVGQGILHVVAGAGRQRNPIYRLFAIVTAPPLHLLRRIMPSFVPEWLICAMTLASVLLAWIALAWLRKSL